jgi:hypothetical protein
MKKADQQSPIRMIVSICSRPNRRRTPFRILTPTRTMVATAADGTQVSRDEAGGDTSCYIIV